MAIACSHPAAGRVRWTLELLAGEMVKLTGAPVARDGAPPPVDRSQIQARLLLNHRYPGQ